MTATPVTSASSPSRATSASTCPCSGLGGAGARCAGRASWTTSTASCCPAGSRPRSTSWSGPSSCATRCARLARRAAGLRLVRRDDHAGRPDRRRPARPADPRRSRHHGPAQRLRPAGRLVRGGPALPGSRGRPAPGRRLRAVFIRAPWVEEAGAGVEVLGTVEDGPAEGRIVAVRQGNLLATSFHPEVTGDHRVHESFRPWCGQPAADPGAGDSVSSPGSST